MAKAVKDATREKAEDQKKPEPGKKPELTKEEKQAQKFKKSALYVLKNLRVKPDYPDPNVLFCDLASVMATPKGNHHVRRLMSGLYDPSSYNAVFVAESRGFLMKDFAEDKFVLIGWKPSPSHAPFPVTINSRKSEYTTEVFQTVTDYVERFKAWCSAHGKEPTVLIVDDLLATGGSVVALATILRELGCTVVGAATLFNLPDSPKDEKLYESLEVRSAISLNKETLQKIAEKKSRAGKELAREIYAELFD